MEKLAFNAIGTQWEIESDSALSRGIRQRILRLIESYESVYSRFRDDSLVSRVASSAQGGVYSCDLQAGLLNLSKDEVLLTEETMIAIIYTNEKRASAAN